MHWFVLRMAGGPSAWGKVICTMLSPLFFIFLIMIPRTSRDGLVVVMIIVVGFNFKLGLRTSAAVSLRDVLDCS